jgi:hypothetical protein
MSGLFLITATSFRIVLPDRSTAQTVGRREASIWATLASLRYTPCLFLALPRVRTCHWRLTIAVVGTLRIYKKMIGL